MWTRTWGRARPLRQGTEDAKHGEHDEKYAAEGLSHYLRHLGGHPQLTREQEYELARRARKGDESARQMLAQSNLAFVVAVAKKFANRGARLDDLIQEGNVGLMKAIEHFDPKKNVRFATYAVWWIRAYITRYLKDNRSQVRGGEAERGSMTDFSLDATIDEDGETTFLDRLEDGGPSPQDIFLVARAERRRSRRRSPRCASALATWAGTSSRSGSRRTSRARWRSWASAGACRASACARWS